MDGPTKDDVESVKTMERHITNATMKEGEVSDADAANLVAMGYKPQMRRDFNIWQLIAYGFNSTASWLGLAGGFTAGIGVGGPACVVWGLVIVATLNIFVVTALAELTSAMPNAGGQYYWVMKLAPHKYRRIAAYFTGYCNLAAGICAGAGNCALFGYMTMACVKLIYPEFIVQTWEIWLVGVGFICVTAIANFDERAVARVPAIGMIISLISWIIMTVSVPASSAEHTTASFVFTSTENSSGWPTYGIAFCVGLINPNYAFGLIDATVHLAEEIKEPEKNVPKALYLTVLIGFVTSFPLAIAFVFCLNRFEEIVGTETGIPLLQLFFFAFDNSKVKAVLLLIVLIICFAIANVSLQTYKCRLAWAFSRDCGLPFSRIFSRVHPRLAIPMYAHILCVTLVAILSLLVIASTAAFNSLAAGVIIFPSLSFFLPICFSLLPENRYVKGPFNLGWFGTLSRIVTLCYAIFSLVMFSFPVYYPVTTHSMNYVSAVIGGVFLIATADWLLRGHKQFRDPERMQHVVERP